MTTSTPGPTYLERPVVTPGVNPRRRRWNTAPCVYGHLDCSHTEWGPCENEHRRLWRVESEGAS